MKSFIKHIITCSVILSPFFLMAQEVDSSASEKPTVVDIDKPPPPKRYYYLSPRVSVTAPNPIANNAFTKSFNGVYELSGGLNIYLYKGVFLGAIYKYGTFKITDNKISNYNVTMQTHSVAGKFGGDFYLGDNNKIIFSSSVSAGYSWTEFDGLICKIENKPPDVTSYQSTYIEPELNLFFLIESNFAIGVTLSYGIYSHVFNPYELCLNEWKPYSKSNSGATQFINFGFGFYYSLIKKKK